MPSKSAKQHRFMEAIAHSPSFAKKAGVPQSVGRDFSDADKRSGKFTRKTIVGSHKRPRVTQTPFGGDDLAGS